MTQAVYDTLESWRAEANRLAILVESLEHEVGMLKEKLRRIKGYVNSAWREDEEVEGYDEFIARTESPC